MSWLARLSRNMQEVRLVFDVNDAKSVGCRQFVDKNYMQIKRLNPRLPFIVRTGPGAPPHLVARYDYGGEAHRDLSGKTPDEIKELLKELNSIGEVALRADLHWWQEGVPKDFDTVKYDAYDPTLHPI